eukprot:EG_transcript_16972
MQSVQSVGRCPSAGTAEAFQQMLADLQVHPTVEWKAAMKTLVKDARYTALKTPKERQEAYEHYCRDNQSAVQQEARRRDDHAFRQLLLRLYETGRLDHTTTWERFLEQAR